MVQKNLNGNFKIRYYLNHPVFAGFPHWVNFAARLLICYLADCKTG
jgi:hypothetical protein